MNSNTLLIAFALIIATQTHVAASKTTGPNHVTVVNDERGSKLVVDGRDFLMQGVSWGYVPVGTNYSYDLFSQNDAFIERVLKRDMTLLQKMGANAIRLHAGVPPRWVEYIYQRFGVYTIIYHNFGRYGLTLDGAWVPNTNYQDPDVRAHLKAEAKAFVHRYKNTPGVLLWLLGNENNYGLHWSSNEIEALPKDEQQAGRAAYLYSLYGETIDLIHQLDTHHPVSLSNGDIQYIDLIAKHAKNLDLLSTNIYRGISVVQKDNHLFEIIKEKLGVPVYFGEFGADAYNAKLHQEDQLNQARYLHGQWREIYEYSYGKGLTGNCAGGLIFQWADGWWKYMQETNLHVHDDNASWPNGGYPSDYVPGQNNMNEEWFGICAKSPAPLSEVYPLHCRAAYYLVKDAFELAPFAPSTTLDAIAAHFSSLDPKNYTAPYEHARNTQKIHALETARVSNIRMQFETVTSDGYMATTNTNDGFDHLESFYTDFSINPDPRFSANLSLNVLGNVPANYIDQIFFEDRGLPKVITTEEGEQITLADPEHVKVYQSNFLWRSEYFELEGFYRKGHYHWGYEGDFFGLYPEANYEPDVDRYNSNAPSGMVFRGKGTLGGLKVAFGPEIYWGANPTVIAKYQGSLAGTDFALMHQEDITRQLSVTSSSVIPEQVTRKSTLHATTQFGSLKLEFGGIFAGSEKVGQSFYTVREGSGRYYGEWDPSVESPGYDVLQDEIHITDTLGGKVKLTYQSGGIGWYAQGSYKGLVADGGANYTTTFTGWSLKEDGRGNHYDFLTGLYVNVGYLQIAPNFLYQKPLEGPLPAIGDHFSPDTGNYYPGVSPRNIMDDPFAVLGNRETLGFELMLTFDPTPATWFWHWDSASREDAAFAMALDFVYRAQPTSRDSGIGFTQDGKLQAFGGAPPAADTWEAKAIFRSRIHANLRFFGQLYAGKLQANGAGERVERMVTRMGGDIEAWWHTSILRAYLKLNDWGRYDYQRDWNFTFPVQAMLDCSYGLNPPVLYMPDTRVGLRGKYRILNEHSDRYPYEIGNRSFGEEVSEWELVTYMSISL